MISQEPAAGTPITAATSVTLVIGTVEQGDTVAVPNIVGRTVPEAEKLLKEVGLKLGQRSEKPGDPVGTVLDQSPAAGTRVSPGSAVNIVIAIAPPDDRIEVPELVGKSLQDAEKILKKVGLQVGRVSFRDDDRVDQVLEQAPKAGDRVAQDTAVDLIVGRARDVERTKVPRVTGQTLPGAAEILEAARLKVGEVSGSQEGRVTQQKPAAGAEVPVGTPVDLQLTGGRAFVDRLTRSVAADRGFATLEVAPTDLRARLVEAKVTTPKAAARVVEMENQQLQADLRSAQSDPRAEFPADGARRPGAAGGRGLSPQPMSATLAAASAAMPPAQRLENAPVLELVLMRVRLRARRRAAWLAHLHGRPEERSDFAAEPTLAACLDGRDAPDAEAAWYGQAEVAQPLNDELERVERALAGEAGARLRELQRMFRLSEPETALLETCLALALDPGLGAAFGHLQQSPARGYVTEPLAARLFGHGRRPMCEAGCPLTGWGLVAAGEAPAGEPVPMTVDPIVISWLQGELRMDPQLMGLGQVVEPRPPLAGWPVTATAHAIHRMVERGASARVLLIGPPASGRRTFAAAVAKHFGIMTLAVDTSEITRRRLERHLHARAAARGDGQQRRWSGTAAGCTGPGRATSRRRRSSSSPPMSTRACRRASTSSISGSRCRARRWTSAAASGGRPFRSPRPGRRTSWRSS